MRFPTKISVAQDGVQAVLTVELVNDRPIISQLSVTSTDPKGLTGDQLRRLQLRRLASAAVADHVTRIFALTVNRPPGYPSEGPTDENLDYVAAVYLTALRGGNHPTLALREDLPARTVSRWVAIARKQGKMPPRRKS